MITRPTIARRSICALALALASGCDDSKPPETSIKIRETVGKTTQDVRNLKVETGKGGVATDGKIHATDYITLQADAYRTSVAKIAKMTVQTRMAEYDILNNEKIKTYDEFMEKVIKKGQPDGLMLPKLPYYQEYGFDPDTCELVVIEYPAKKKEFDAAYDKKLGR